MRSLLVQRSLHKLAKVGLIFSVVASGKCSFGLDLLSRSHKASNLIHAPVVMRIDAHHNVHIHGQRPAGGIRLVSDRRTALNKPSTGNRGMNSRAKLPRPPNSFILYRQHHHPLLKETQPNLHNNEICKWSNITYSSQLIEL